MRVLETYWSVANPNLRAAAWAWSPTPGEPGSAAHALRRKGKVNLFGNTALRSMSGKKAAARRRAEGSGDVACARTRVLTRKASIGTEGPRSAATRGSSSAGAAEAVDAKSLVRTSGLECRPDLRRKARDWSTATGVEERSRRRRQCCSAARAAGGGWCGASAVEKRRRRKCSVREGGSGGGRLTNSATVVLLLTIEELSVDVIIVLRHNHHVR
jgi:hypothetical protein